VTRQAIRTGGWARWAAATAAAALACAGRPEPAPALCVLERAPSAGEPDAQAWIALLLRGYDPATRRLTSPPLDCTGAQIRWEGPAMRCDDGRVATTALADRPLEPADVVASRVSADTTLVWIATTHYATGDAAGPVALVKGSNGRLRVVALGVLRAYREKARLRLERLGATAALVADGELCPPGDDAACIRASRLVPLRGDRFAPTPLVAEDGRCLAPAWFDLARQERARSEQGWERLELTASMSFSGAPSARLLVEEQVVVHDASGRDPLASARVLRRAQSTREVRWENGRLVASGTPLWWRVSYGER
jgi:hypothetical protein